MKCGQEGWETPDYIGAAAFRRALYPDRGDNAQTSLQGMPGMAWAAAARGVSNNSCKKS
jgi:hypothetical protein